MIIFRTLIFKQAVLTSRNDVHLNSSDCSGRVLYQRGAELTGDVMVNGETRDEKDFKRYSAYVMQVCYRPRLYLWRASYNSNLLHRALLYLYLFGTTDNMSLTSTRCI